MCVSECIEINCSYSAPTNNRNEFTLSTVQTREKLFNKVNFWFARRAAKVKLDYAWLWRHARLLHLSPCVWNFHFYKFPFFRSTKSGVLADLHKKELVEAINVHLTWIEAALCVTSRADRNRLSPFVRHRCTSSSVLCDNFGEFRSADRIAQQLPARVILSGAFRCLSLLRCLSAPIRRPLPALLFPLLTYLWRRMA